MRINKRLVSAVAAVAAVTLLASCASGESGSGDGNGDGNGLASANVLLPIPAGLAFTPLIVAQESGFFADAGLDVTYSVADGSGYLSPQIGRAHV